MNKTLIALTLLATALAVQAQQQNTDFKITKITPDLVTTADYTFSYGPKNKKVAKNKEFLEVEVSFDWQPKAQDPAYLDDLTINYYVLLSNKSKEYPKGALLIGSVTHSAIPQGKDMHSVVYVSPRTLERFFDGKAPTSAATAVVDVGVTITKQGATVAEGSWKGRGQWWTALPQVPGYVLNKNQTPFAPLAWDYYEAIKSGPAGM